MELTDRLGGTIVVWSFSLRQGPEVAERLYRTLSHDEKLRAERLRFEADRQRFVVRRGALRDILSRHVRQTPDRLIFRRSAAGKPHLVAPASRPVSFSTSSSNDGAVV